MSDPKHRPGRLLLAGALALIFAVLAGCLFYQPTPPWVTPPRAETAAD